MLSTTVAIEEIKKKISAFINVSIFILYYTAIFLARSYGVKLRTINSPLWRVFAESVLDCFFFLFFGADKFYVSQNKGDKKSDRHNKKPEF
jgi:hypothetical protein